MIPVDIISINLAIITVTCTFWGAAWQFFLKEKISTYNQRVDDSKLKTLEEFNQKYNNITSPDSKIEILNNISKKIEKIQEKKIQPEDINKYLFFIVISSAVSIITKFLEPSEGGIITGEITFNQIYGFLTLLSMIVFVIFAFKTYKVNKKFSIYDSTETLLKMVEDEIKEEDKFANS